MRLFVFLIVFGSITQLNAQFFLPAHNATANTFSLTTATTVGILSKTAEPKIERRLKDYAPHYNKRLLKYARTLLDNAQIRNEVTATIQRTDSLLTKNEALNFFYTFKKRDNRTSLESVRTALITMQQRLNGMDPNTIYGERMNLNLDVETALDQVHRHLDQVSDAIDHSTILSKLTGLE